MSDYTKTTDFAVKDGLASGNPAKAAKGTEVDTELDNIATAIATKYDVNDRGAVNGIAPLDSNAEIPAVNIPDATEILTGGFELATAAEALAITANDKIVTPLRSVDTFAGNIATGDTVAGLLADIWSYVDPGVDTVWGWDEGTNSLVDFPEGDGITLAAGTIAMDLLGLEDLVDPGADRVYFWDDTAGLSDWAIPGDGLTIDNGSSTLGLEDVAATTTNAIDIAAGSVEIDLTALTTMPGNDMAAGDRVYVDDGGVQKAILIEEVGLRTQMGETTQTLAAADMNSIMGFDATATVTIPLNSTTALPVGVPIVMVMDHATQEVTVTADASVTLHSVFHPGGAVAASDTLVAGGTAILFQAVTDEWYFTGDIAT